MWYVEYLLLNREKIKLTSDFESEEYLDLLTVEKALNNLIRADLISDSELAVLDLVINLDDFGTKSTSSFVPNRSDFMFKIFGRTCDRVAEVLGGAFTDAGFIEKLRIKYNLNDQQTKRLEKFMRSEYRFAIMKKPYKEN